MTVKELEGMLMTHLAESGEIRADLKWLKKAFWVLATAAVSANFTLLFYLISRGGIAHG